LYSLPYLHEMTYVLAVGEYLAEVLSAQDVAESGLGEEAGGTVGVLDVRHRDGGVRDAVVDHRVDGHRYRVLRKDL